MPRLAHPCFRELRRIGAPFLVMATLGALNQVSGALLADSQTVGGNTLSTRPDWAPPTTGSASILNDLGYTGILRQGSAFRVCALVSDEGSPPSGTSAVSVNLAVPSDTISDGATAVPLASGSFTCMGSAFNYQSESQTSDALIAEGPRSFHVTATDNLSQAAITTWNAVIDNTAPTALSFDTHDKTGGTPGLIENGDSFSVSVSEASIDLSRILSGWDGAPAPVVVKVLNNAFGSGKDGFWVCEANTAHCAGGTHVEEVLGAVNLNNKDYVKGTVVFDGSIAWDTDLKRLTVTLADCSKGCANIDTGGASSATFTPLSGASQGGIRDQAGNDMSTGSTADETGVHF